MRVRDGVCFFLVLVIQATANAQERGGHPAHQGGMVPHGNQGQGGHPQQHMMTPQMQHEMMMQQFWHEQMMLNEMMAPRGRSRGQNRNSAQSSAGNKGQPGASLATTAGNPQSKSGLSKEANGSQIDPSRAAQPRQQHADETKGKQDAKRSMERERSLVSSTANHGRKGAAANTRKARPSDRLDIAKLHDVHKRLTEADHDYQGHRVKAMQHVASALEHLGAPAIGANLGYSWGNLPQEQSDRLLRDSLVQLNQAEKALRSGTNLAAHHESARTSVAEAIRELHSALAVR
jgi:hypothetical protein